MSRSGGRLLRGCTTPKFARWRRDAELSIQRHARQHVLHGGSRVEVLKTQRKADQNRYIASAGGKRACGCCGIMRIGSCLPLRPLRLGPAGSWCQATCLKCMVFVLRLRSAEFAKQVYWEADTRAV